MRYDLLDEDPEEVPENGGDPQEEWEQESEESHTQLSQQEAECIHADAVPHSPQDDLPQEDGWQDHNDLPWLTRGGKGLGTTDWKLKKK